MIKLFYNATLAITGGTTIAGGLYGTYQSYKESKNQPLTFNIAHTCFGGLVGAIGGLGIGFTWPIASSVVIARLLEETNEREQQKMNIEKEQL